MTTSLKEAFADLLLDDASLEAGSKLYRRNCLHCHGVTGNGRGPTGPWLSPHPRDSRKGQFKYISTGKQAPSRNDLYRVLKNGVDYTSMPSFALLTDKELDQLISYVIHLSLRGQAEEATMTALLRKEELQVDGEDVSIDAFLQEKVRYAVLQGKTGDEVAKSGGWAGSNKSVLTPKEQVAGNETRAAKEKDIESGYKLFISDDAGCLKCHEDFGRGSLYLYDSWGTFVQPRNLTAGLYRGGRRPIDFFWRIRGGIKPSTMPALDVLLTPEEKEQLAKMTDRAAADGKKAEMTEANVWRLVAFIQAVPYPAMLPPTVRKQIYPTPPVLAKKAE